MKRRLITGMAAGFLGLCAAPALAAPATVTVRVEGDATTKVETVRVTTTTAPVSRAGHDCSGTSAGGALDLATAGDWDAKYFEGLGHYVTKIRGEEPAGFDYWTLWVNNAYSQSGACGRELQDGDDLLFFVQHCAADGVTCREPLGLAVPAGARAGGTGEVAVVKYAVDGTASPVAGARVAGSGIDVTTDEAGKATVTFPATGLVTLQATKDGLIRSAKREVLVSPPGLTPGPPSPADRTAPSATLSGLRDKQTLRRGPRELRGRFADASGVKAVKLRLTKRLGKRCWYFSGRMERFRGARCGRGAYFTIGDRADWSYLLPARLGKGRYVLDAIAIDRAGNRTPLRRGTTRVVFTVR
jgi:hypothetical protein